MQKTRFNRPNAALVVFGACWLLLMAALVWRHARGATQPPIYDALTYFTKGKYVWAALRDGDLLRLLNTEPVLRPPGTVLMSFPFGFDGSYPGFYFRSVFAPILLVFVAVCVATGGVARSWRDAGRVGLTAAFLTTLSLFYYFEPYDGGPMLSYWGLVDSFQTGLAALAAACVIRSVRDESIGWGLVATLVGVVMIYVKPSGTLLAALLGTSLTLGWVSNLWWGRAIPAQRRRTSIALGVLVGVEAILLGGAVLLALNSPYLGAESMAFGKASIVVMRSEINLDLGQLMAIVRLGLGPFLPVWFVAVVLLIAYVRLARRPAPARESWSLATGSVTFFAGLWFWLVVSGGRTEIRYFTPFLYVAIICAIGPSFRALDRVARPFRWLVSLLMLAAVGNVVALLALPDPALAWQDFSGVNVMSGFDPKSIGQAQQVVDQTPADVKSVTVYSINVDMSDAMFLSVFHLHMLGTDPRKFIVKRPLDWQRPTMFRSEEIVAADYILFDPRQATENVPFVVDDFPHEQRVFDTWAKGLTSRDGIEVESTQPASTLLRIVDRSNLSASLERLVASHRWRQIVADANAPVWWSDDQVATALAATRPTIPALEHVRFDDRFEARAATIERVADDSLELRVWLRTTGPDDPTGWVLLVHYVDADGKILAAPDLALTAMASSTPQTPYFFVHKQLLPPPGTAKVAIGVYRGNVILLADKGTRDWGGKRVLLDLPPRRAAP